MAYINGARGVDRISLAVRANFMKVMRLTWCSSPITIALAQNYLPPEVWGAYDKSISCVIPFVLTNSFFAEPFFTFVRFILSTWINTMAKKKCVTFSDIVTRYLTIFLSSRQMELARQEAGKKGKGKIAGGDVEKGAAKGN